MTLSPASHSVARDAGSPLASVRRVLLRSETATLLLAVLAVYVGTVLSDSFWQPHLLLFNSGAYIEFGFLALPMTLLIAMGEIDLSVGAMVGVCASLLGWLHLHHMPIAPACVLTVVAGGLCGLVNGAIVTRLRLPSLVVTLATLAIFRGIAEELLGSQTVILPLSFSSFDQKGILGGRYDIPREMALFLVLAAVFAFVLHRTIFGRVVLTVGANREVARFSGMRVDRARMIAFLASGLMSGLVGVLLASRNDSVTFSVGSGYELLAITVVVLGGADIFGGRASMLSTVFAVFAVIALREALTVYGSDGLVQDGIVGLILIGAVLAPILVRTLSGWLRARTPHDVAVPAAAGPINGDEGAP